MAVTEELPLKNKDVYPSDEVIFSIIGDKKIVWQGIMDHICKNYPDSAGEWRYYNDGKQWLFKMVRRKKTIFWTGLIKNTFRITFYFSEKNAYLIEESDLPQSVRDNYKSSVSPGKITPITTEISGTPDMDMILKLIDLKVKSR